MFEDFRTLLETIEDEYSMGIEQGGVRVKDSLYSIEVTVDPPSKYSAAAGVQKSLRNKGFESDGCGIYTLEKNNIHDHTVETVHISEIDTSMINSLECKLFLKNYLDQNGEVDIQGFKKSIDAIVKGIQEDCSIVMSAEIFKQNS